MLSQLSQLVEQLRRSPGILAKQELQLVAGRSISATAASATGASAIGDDCAAIPDGEGYLLLASEGLLPNFVATDPWFAGWSAVMVNLSDIAAMGGHAIALVDALWSQSPDRSTALWDGMQAAAQTYQVPIVGGHSNHHSPYAALAVSVLGRADRLISSFQSRPGDRLLLAVDLHGKLHPRYPFWDAATQAEPLHLRRSLKILPELAAAGLCEAGKDISMGGLIGTLLMLLETSRCGARLDLAAIPRPPEVPIAQWLTVFPSYGFLLSLRPAAVDAVQAAFRAQQIASAPVGEITADRQLWLQEGAESVLFWDLATTPLMGF